MAELFVWAFGPAFVLAAAEQLEDYTILRLQLSVEILRYRALKRQRRAWAKHHDRAELAAELLDTPLEVYRPKGEKDIELDRAARRRMNRTIRKALKRQQWEQDKQDRRDKRLADEEELRKQASAEQEATAQGEAARSPAEGPVTVAVADEVHVHIKDNLSELLETGALDVAGS